MSRFLGAFNIPQSQSKVILLEKRDALETFGLAPGLMGSFKGYYLSYGSTTLTLGVSDPAKLPPFGKHAMLRHRRVIKLEQRHKIIKELEDKDVEEEEDKNKDSGEP